MRWQSIEVENFNGVSKRKVDLADTPYATVVGQNGAGKSTILVDAPLFALFGRSAVREDLASVVKRGEETASAELVFVLGDDLFRVKRTYSIRTKAGSQSLDVWRNDELINAATMTETQKNLEGLIGCSFDVMVMGSIMRQGESDRFARCTPAERLRLLGALLGADKFREGKTTAAQKLRDAESAIRGDVSRLAEMKDLPEQLKAIRDEITRLDAEAASFGKEIVERTKVRDAIVEKLASIGTEFPKAETLQAAQGAHAHLIDRNRKKYEDAVTSNEEVDKIFAQREMLRQLKEREEEALEKLLASKPDPFALKDLAEAGKAEAANLATLESQLESWQEYEKAKSDYDRKFESLSKQTGALKLRPDECQMDHCGLIKSAVEAKRELDSLLKPAVPEGFIDTGSTMLTVDSLKKAVREATTIVEECRAKYKSLQTELRTFQTRVEEQERAVRIAGQKLADSPVARKAKIDLAELKAEHAKAEDVTRERLARLREEERQHKAGIEQAKAEVQRTLNEANEYLRSLEQSLRTTSSALASQGAKADEIDRQIAKSKELEERIAKHQDEIDLLNHAVKFLSVAPQLVVERALPVIEAVANDVLEQIQPGALIEVRQSRETKSGTVKDEINVICIADGYEAPLATFSGGERFRIDLALRLGIAAASGAKLETLVIDEGWGSQDSEKLEQVKEAISALAERFPRIYTISHVAAVEDMFGEIIRI